MTFLILILGSEFRPVNVQVLSYAHQPTRMISYPNDLHYIVATIAKDVDPVELEAAHGRLAHYEP